MDFHLQRSDAPDDRIQRFRQEYVEGCGIDSANLCSRKTCVDFLGGGFGGTTSCAIQLRNRFAEHDHRGAEEEDGDAPRTGASSPRPLYLTECLLIGPKENAA